jgi:hypothetical protein
MGSRKEVYITYCLSVYMTRAAKTGSLEIDEVLAVLLKMLLLMQLISSYSVVKISVGDLRGHFA